MARSQLLWRELIAFLRQLGEAILKHGVSARAWRVVIVAVVLGVAAVGVLGWRRYSNRATPAQRAETLIAQGLKAHELGDDAKAQTDYAKALKHDPSNAIAAYDLGQLAQELGDVQAATSYYEQAIKNNPKMTSAMFNEAVLVTTSDPARALALYKRIVVIQPNAPTAFLNLGLLEVRQKTTLQQGEIDLAQAVFLDASLRSQVPAGLQIPTVKPFGSAAP